MRYYFHFKSGDTVETDDEGIELADLSAAAREAELSAREILAEAIKARKPDVPEAVVITDDSGTEVYSFPMVALLPKTLIPKTLKGDVGPPSVAASIARCRPLRSRTVSRAGSAKDRTASSCAAPGFRCQSVPMAGCWPVSDRRGLVKNAVAWFAV